MTATISEVTAGVTLAYKNLVDEQLWERLVSRIIKDEDVERALAERIMNEALGFLELCANEPDGKHSPSATVDIGWHTFILYTREYAAFCQRDAGRFIHHEPTDVPGMDYTGANDSAYTMQVMLARGPVDKMLWTHAADCNSSGCHGGDCNQGCSSGGR
jgi:hypothetical protein